VLQCAAVCCSVLQCAAVCCSVLQCAAVCCSVLQWVAACCSVLQCVAVCCSVLQCVITWFPISVEKQTHENRNRLNKSIIQIGLFFHRRFGGVVIKFCPSYTPIFFCKKKPFCDCITMQHTAAHCNTLQHTATHSWISDFFVERSPFCDRYTCSATHCGTPLISRLFFRKDTFLWICYTANQRKTLQEKQWLCCSVLCSLVVSCVDLQFITLQINARHYKRTQHTATQSLFPGSFFWEKESFSREYNTLQHDTTHCNTLQHTATHCNTLQHTATHCNTLLISWFLFGIRDFLVTAIHCNTLQHTATHPSIPNSF